MGESNGNWGHSVETPADDARWERFARLRPLDADCPGLLDMLGARGLTLADMERVGARWGTIRSGLADGLVYYFPGGLKWRHVTTGARESEPGAVFDRLKKVPSLEATPVGAIIAEGETDAAMLSRLASDCDVWILPSGARTWTATMTEQVRGYENVWVATDADRAGNDGARKIMDAVPHARRLVPPAKDWCEATLPEDWHPATAAPKLRRVWSVGEVLDADLGDYASNNWFQDPILPLAGLTCIHAKKKSLKSWIMFELARAVACGDVFAGSCNFTRPAGCGRVLLYQLEIQAWSFQQRLLSLYATTPDNLRPLLRENLYVRGVLDGLPRMRVTDINWIEQVRRDADECGAEVLCFDPIQRMTGSANMDRANEIDPLLDGFAQLQQHGFTVVFSHHNNKASGRHGRDGDAMSGSQRLSGDPDALCSVWWDEPCVPDENDRREKQRNFTWELRNGAADGRSITVYPNPSNSDLAVIEFGPLLTKADDPSLSAIT